MNKYYNLGLSSEPKIIGVRNGVHQGEIKWERFANKETERIICDYFSVKKLQQNLAFVEPFNFEIEYVEAYKMAKMTDIFGFTHALYGINYFVSDKLKNLLNRFNLPAHAFIKVHIFQKETKYDYWGFYIPKFYKDEVIDFQNTVFSNGDFFDKKTFQFKNRQDFLAKKVFHCEKLYLNEGFDKGLDLFTCMFNVTSYYISESLKNAIEAEGITGANIQEPKNPELYFSS